MDEIATVANRHRLVVVIDQWASEPLRQGMSERGRTVRPFAGTNESKDEAVTVARRLLHEGRLHIPSHPSLI